MKNISIMSISFFLLLFISSCTSPKIANAEDQKFPFELIGSWQMNNKTDFSHEFDTLWGSAALLWYWPPNSFYFDHIDNEWILILAENGEFEIDKFIVINDKTFRFYFIQRGDNLSFIRQGWVTFHFTSDNSLWIEQDEVESIFSTTNFSGESIKYYKISKPNKDFVNKYNGSIFSSY